MAYRTKRLIFTKELGTLLPIQWLETKEMFYAQWEDPVILILLMKMQLPTNFFFFLVLKDTWFFFLKKTCFCRLAHCMHAVSSSFGKSNKDFFGRMYLGGSEMRLKIRPRFIAVLYFYCYSFVVRIVHVFLSSVLVFTFQLLPWIQWMSLFPKSMI